MGKLARRVDIELDKTRPISFPMGAYDEFAEEFHIEKPEDVKLFTNKDTAKILLFMLKYTDPECELTFDELLDLIDAENIAFISAAVWTLMGIPIPDDMKKTLALQGKELPKLYRPTT